jgi:Fe-S oxidoreductase
MKRIQEAKKTGAQALVTQCPFCEQNMDEALTKMDDGIELYDLTELLIKVLGIE